MYNEPGVRLRVDNGCIFKTIHIKIVLMKVVRMENNFGVPNFTTKRVIPMANNIDLIYLILN